MFRCRDSYIDAFTMRRHTIIDPFIDEHLQTSKITSRHPPTYERTYAHTYI